MVDDFSWSGRYLEIYDDVFFHFNTNWLVRVMGVIIVWGVLAVGAYELLVWQNIELTVTYLILLMISATMVLGLFYHSEVEVNCVTKTAIAYDKILWYVVRQKAYQGDSIKSVLVRKEWGIEGGRVYNLYFTLTHEKHLLLLTDTDFHYLSEVGGKLAEMFSKDLTLPT